MSIVVCYLAVFSLVESSSLAYQGVLQDGFCNGVVLSDVAKPGECLSFHCCQQGLLLSGKGIHLFSHNIQESPEEFCFKCLYMSLCLCCQSLALAFIMVLMGCSGWYSCQILCFSLS